MGKFRTWLLWVLAMLAILLLGATFVGLALPLRSLLSERVEGLTTAERLKAANDARTTFVSAMVGAVALGSVIVGLRTYKLSQSGQFTDRYSRAVEHLSSEKTTVRLGGIYALERLAKDSSFDKQAVADVLAAFIREAATVVNSDGERQLSSDAQAAIRVIGAKFMRGGRREVNLAGSSLPLADLRSLDLSRSDLVNADLSMASLDNATLENSNLAGADLRGITANGTKFSGANLTSADLRGVKVHKLKLTDSQMASIRRE
ncbi:pentapeptide repeat-containing protein [Actinophytocola algeriensis]|uniref:Pentapeptide repeat-containing protein n=1 Tax=Actinophytocola algeriensis TaxID=1768010 RepID=A0A7W7VEM6_9PSEU|nr:pentapeptide repeat-containing protein [Actinophytocola algeriensis]MBB4907274.1 hypothetical protein [Actinophytocola algeriensis]MBE1478757.1 hypothetical protein [Actinophytocola algeriensis]